MTKGAGEVRRMTETKKCPACDRTLPSDAFNKNRSSKTGLQVECKKCQAARHRLHYANNTETYRVRHQTEKWKAQSRESARRCWKRDRLDAIAHYGNKCACCGEATLEFLTIDHIKGGGNQHRREIGTHLCRWLKRNNWPSGFQVLCANCNCAKGFYGTCPHQTENK